MLNKSEEAEKRDDGKAQHHLMPFEAYEEVLKVLAYGAGKYEPFGWKKGTKWSRYFNAALRHVWAWWRGETNDTESGCHHLAHAACCILFLIVYDKKQIGTDDRQMQYQHSNSEIERLLKEFSNVGNETTKLKKKSAEPIGGDA